MADKTAPSFRRVLLHGGLSKGLAAWLAADAIRAEPFRADSWSLASDEVGLVLGSGGLSADLALEPRAGLGESADRVGLLQLGELVHPLDPFWQARLVFSIPESTVEPQRARTLLACYRILEERARAAHDRRALLSRTAETQALVEVGIALSAETDRERLLDMILGRARTLTSAEAGSLYLTDPPRSPTSLRFVLAQNDAVPFDFETSTLPLDESSIAGFVAKTGSVLNLPDVRELPAGAPYRFDAAFDERHGYRTRSVLAVPMTTPDGRIIGVLQLLNRKRRFLPDGAVTAVIRSEVVPFDARNAEIARSLAAQAAVAVENRRLTESIRTLFEGFVEASVTAIEQRDPTTSGHSQRVAMLTCALAEAADRTEAGPYAAFRITADELRELRYAAVLHDFGKVGVREQVLVKARKLPPGGRELLRARFDQAMLSAAAELWEEAARRGRELREVEAALEARRAALEEAWRVVERADEPTVLASEAGEELRSLGMLEYRDAAGRAVPLASAGEIACLAIPIGSLTPPERAEIESHVAQTFRFLVKIPWTEDLGRVPEWAYAHHEKLDGSGYPRRLTSGDIPVPVRMLTICDIFDALAARDRPYKKAVAPARALEILEAQAAHGALDPELLRIFVDAGIWRAS